MKLSLNGQRFEYAIQIKSRDIIYKDGSSCILTVRPTDNQLFVSCVEWDVLLQYEIVYIETLKFQRDGPKREYEVCLT